MDLQTIVIAVGGSGALFGAVGWMVKSVVTQVLNRDIERFKSVLTATSAATTERLKHDLHIVATEHQVRYVKLYERRAEVITELYALLVQAQWASHAFVSPVSWAGDKPKNELYVIAMNEAAEFYRYFDKNRIYIPQKTCDQIEDFLGNMRREIIGFGVFTRLEESQLPPATLEKMHDAWAKASEYFDKEVPKARAALEAELRSIM